MTFSNVTNATSKGRRWIELADEGGTPGVHLIAESKASESLIKQIRGEARVLKESGVIGDYDFLFGDPVENNSCGAAAAMCGRIRAC